MTHEPEGRRGARPSALMLLGALATVHCNALLGIEEATCSGSCDAQAAGEQTTVGELLPGSGAPARHDAGQGTAAPLLPEGVASGAQETPLDSAGQTPAPSVEDIIAAACAEQTSGEPFCVVNRRVTCGTDGAPDSIGVCADADHCLRGSGPECATCSAQSFVCQAAELWRCEAGAMVRSESCGSAALCNAAMGRCEAPVCAPDQRRCLGAQLQVCNAERTGFRVEAECASAELCDAAAGACAPPACSPNQRRCLGLVMQECNASRSAFDVVDVCVTAALCDAEAGVCRLAACVPDQQRCQGAALQRCNPSGTGFSVVQQCASAALCDPAASACVTPACATNQRRCQGAVLEQCNAERTAFVRLDACASAALCDAQGGACQAPACAANQRRCQGARLEECNASRTGFVLVAECEGAASCHPVEGCDGGGSSGSDGGGNGGGGGGRNDCVVGERRCQGRNLQECDERRGRFENIERCRSEADCDPLEGCDD